MLLDERKFKDDFGIIEEPPVDETELIEEEEVTWEQLSTK